MVVNPTGNLLFEQPLMSEQDSGFLVSQGTTQSKMVPLWGSTTSGFWA
jgi:hypothetical protein